jgi:ferredoxin-NADP reductase
MSTLRTEAEYDLVLERKETMAEGVVRLTLRDAAGRPVPEWQPGAHVDLLLRADLVRQYSLCGDRRIRPACRSRCCVNRKAGAGRATCTTNSPLVKAKSYPKAQARE